MSKKQPLPKPANRHWTKLFRVSLSALLMAMFAFCVLIAIETNRIHNQRYIVNFMGGEEKLAESSTYKDIGFETRYPILNDIQWLRSILGEDWNRDIMSIEISYRDDGLNPIPNELINRLTKLKQLRNVAIIYHKLTDDQALRLGTLKCLQWIHFFYFPERDSTDNVKLKDETIERIRRMLPNTFVTNH